MSILAHRNIMADFSFTLTEYPSYEYVGPSPFVHATAAAASFGVDVTTFFASDVEGFPFTTPERPLLFCFNLFQVY